MKTITEKRWKLPTGFLSYSQLYLWKKSQTRYRRRYFRRIREEDTLPLHIGRLFSEMYETGDLTDAPPGAREALQRLEVLEAPEQALLADLGTFDAKIIVDMTRRDFSRIIEYKTGMGENAWTQERVNQHEQLDLDALVIWKRFGHIPEIVLQWAQTEFDELKRIRFTGRVETFERVIRLNEVKDFRDKVEEVAHKISRAYRAFLGEADFESDLFEEYALMYREYKELEEELQRLKAELDKRMQAQELDQWETQGVPGLAYYTSGTRWQYSPRVERLKEELKALQEREKEEGIAEKVQKRGSFAFRLK